MLAPIYHESVRPKPLYEMSREDWTEQRKQKTWFKSAGIIIESNGKYLIVKDPETKIWSFPKGSPEPQDFDDTFVTASREVWEETGLSQVTDQNLKRPKALKFPQNCWYFVADLREGHEDVAQPREGETEEVRWCTKDDLMDLYDHVNNGIRHFLRHFL